MTAGKVFTLFISNEDINDIIKIIKSENPGVLVDRVTKPVKHEIKEKSGFLGALLAPLAASLVQPAIASEVKGISEEEFEDQEEDKWLQIFSSTRSFKQYRDY